VLDTVPEVQDAAGAAPLPEPVRGDLAFEKVSFGYGGRKGEPVLSEIDLTIEAGRTVAFLGATGAGKSTLVHLVPRFYDVTEGRILLDGIDIRKLTQESLLSAIAIVPQETVLFSGTVRDNIRYGDPGAADGEVRSAAEAAQAHEFILALPEGYDTHVEERGVNLSGGQKQRIAIARALLMRPKIMILDDCTSAVDTETETKIQEALEERLAGCTKLVVAQRISTVLKADTIVILENGRIAAEGPHSELIASCPVYREIFDSQLGNGTDPGNGATLRSREVPV
jgi:ATP-binding cassette subfamily B protein